MKFRLLFSIAVITVLALQPILSQNFLEKANETGYDKVEANLLEGLKSDNCGLKISSTYFLGELKSTKAVIPLMEMLRCNDNVDARIIAALSLTKIENERGIYMVKMEAKFNDSERIREKCDHFYKAFVMKKYKETNYSIAGNINPTNTAVLNNN